MNTLTPEMHQDSNFSILYDAIEKRMKESPAIAASKTGKDSISGENVSATNGGVAVGNINIGGNVEGSNIIIGNNNQVKNNKKQ